jgi:hypothetical protein
MMRTIRLAAMVCLCLPMSGLAQANTGTVYGSVVDAQGKVVAGGTVTVRSTDNSSARTATSDASGQFGITGLVPGAYTVEAKFNGLALRRPVRLTVGLGSSTQLEIKLEVARVRTGTTVTAGGRTSEGNTTTPPINTTEPEVNTFLAGTVVTYLPNRDRDFAQLDQLSANAHEDSEGTGISIGGQRSNALVTIVDGVDFNSPLLGGLRGAADRGFLLPQTVVREFQIVSSGVDAEVGMTDAGLINVATKEGSNRLHGEAFYTARPATLSSADAFGNTLDNAMNTFGWSDGGKIRKDKSFFYAGFEADFLRLPTFTVFAPQAAGTVVPTALSGLQGQTVEHNTPLGFSGRIDQILNEKNTLNLELIGNRLRASNVLGDGLSRTLSASTVGSSVSGQSFFSKVGLTTVVTPRMVNQATVSWSLDHREQTPNSTAPEVFINGFGVLGGDGLGAHLYSSKSTQVIDNVSIVRGKRQFEFGGNLNVDPVYEQREENLNGRFDYDSLVNYEVNLPRRFQQTFVTGNTRYQGTVNEFGLFANAHLELNKNLTLTTGLRWGAQRNPEPAPTNTKIVQTTRVPNDVDEWQPRLGLAWTPLKKTVVKASTGLYVAPTPATFFHRAFVDNGLNTVVADSYFDPQLLTLTGALTPTPHALAVAPAGLTIPSALIAGVDPHFKNPTSMQSAVTVDQTISSKVTMRGGYMHASTWHLERRLDENLSAPTINAAGLPVYPTTRPISGVGRLLVEQSSAHSSYDGLTIDTIAQISRRSQFTVNYTLARTHDDDSNLGPYSIDSALDPFDLALERGPSGLDMRNTLNVAAIFNLPLGLKLNPIFVAHSGAPYTALIGFDTQNDANDFNDRALIGGVESSRNQFRQPSFNDTDVRIVKDFTLKGEGHHLDLFMDIFNITGTGNRNFGPEQVSLYGNSTYPVFSAGQALFAPGASMVGGPREFQFTARLVGF